MKPELRIARKNELSELNWKLSKLIFKQIFDSFKSNGSTLKTSDLTKLVRLANGIANDALYDRELTHQMDLFKALEVLVNEGLADPNHCGMLGDEFAKLTEKLKTYTMKKPESEDNCDG